MPDFANDGQGGLIAPSQDSGNDPFAVFNEVIPLMGEDEGFIMPNISQEEQPLFENNQQAAPAAPAAPAPVDNNSQPPAPAGTDQNIFEETENIFKDDIVDQFAPKTTDQFNADEAIKKLQEQGFKIEKTEATDVNQAEAAELQRLDQELAQTDNFLQQNNDQVITEKVKNDLAREYTSFGKGHLIGTEEFNIEVESKVERIGENETTKQMYADNIRKGIQDYASGLKNKKEEITEKKNVQFKQQLAEKRKSLQTAISGLMKTKFLGMDVTAEAAQEVYNEITSGNFTKEIDANPSLVAEFAFFKKNRESIMTSFGGATFGEGVKAAVDAIQNNAAPASRSSLQQAMTSSSNAQGTLSRSQAWRTPENGGTNEQKPVAAVEPVVAGRGGI